MEEVVLRLGVLVDSRTSEDSVLMILESARADGERHSKRAWFVPETPVGESRTASAGEELTLRSSHSL